MYSCMVVSYVLFYCVYGRSPKESLISTWRYCVEGSLEVKLPIVWTDEAAKVGRVREEKGAEQKKPEKRKQEKRRSKEKSQNTCFIQCFVAPEGRTEDVEKA